MQLQLIRNATMKLQFAGCTLLTDPMLASVGAYDGFAGIARNPTAPLPLPVAEVLADLAAVLISHDHPDHIDPAALELIPKVLPIFCQPGDADTLRRHGFKTVTAIEDRLTWGPITFTRIVGAHGRGQIGDRMGPVSGFILQAAQEPTLYWVGDSVWCGAVQTAIAAHAPEVIVTHSGGATLPGFDPIIMDAEETLAVVRAAPQAVVVAIHLESLDHCPVTRADLRRRAADAGIDATRLMIPADGDVIRRPPL
ncbi:MAG: MBL fold metallo-hydrolase [Desulfosarcinaceae bacterium]|nr:MBL fold metallo-hydrolase [Desulfosarcinaceae bacterium]